MQRRFSSVRASRIQASRTFSKRRSQADSKSGLVVGLSPEWFDLINVQVPEDVCRKNPQLLIDVVIFYDAEIKRQANDKSFVEELINDSKFPEKLLNVACKKFQSISTDDEISEEIKKITQNSGTIENYKGLKLIKQGIYSATHCQMKIPLKIFKIDLENKATRKSTLLDLYVLKNLHHENLLNLIEAHLIGHNLLIVMEHPMSLELSELISKRELSEPEILAITHQVLEGLSFLHKNGIVHRNVMANNVLVGMNKSIRLANYGFCTNITEAEVDKNNIPYWLPSEV
jgi:serine/threonine protein kinase